MQRKILSWCGSMGHYRRVEYIGGAPFNVAAHAANSDANYQDRKMRGQQAARDAKLGVDTSFVQVDPS